MEEEKSSANAAKPTRAMRLFATALNVSMALGLVLAAAMVIGFRIEEALCGVIIILVAAIVIRVIIPSHE